MDFITRIDSDKQVLVATRPIPELCTIGRGSIMVISKMKGAFKTSILILNPRGVGMSEEAVQKIAEIYGSSQGNNPSSNAMFCPQ